MYARAATFRSSSVIFISWSLLAIALGLAGAYRAAPDAKRTWRPSPFFAGAFACLGLLSLAACGPTDAKQSTSEPPAVKIVAVASMEPRTSRFTGVIRARTESNLGFRVAGKIFERLVDPGDRVREGQPLMRLDPIDFELALNSAQAATPSSIRT
jgi:multidrug efflux pump subunit AcrA (membrane-fusion protein)